MKKAIFSLAFALLFVNANSTKAPVTIELKSYQQIIQKDKDGKKRVVWVKPTKVVPGSIIKYVATINNSSKEVVKDASINAKIDKNLLYIPNSIESALKYSVEFSIDGKKFADAKDLKVTGKDGKKYTAKASDYRAIKFNIASIPAESNNTISYKVKVK